MKGGNLIIVLLIIFQCHVILRVTGTMEDMTRLMDDLFANYSREIRPIRNQSDQLIIYTSFFLLSILDVDEVAGSISLTGGLTMAWTDFRLTWKSDDYGGILNMMVNSSKIWSPNIFLVSSSADLEKLSLQDFDARISNVGVVIVSPGKMIRSTCTVDMTNFPTDSQTCHLVFLPWGYYPSEIQLSFLQQSVNMDNFDENGEWGVYSTVAEIYNSHRYESKSAVYTIVLRRKSAYFVISMIVPVYILCFLNPFVFLLPATSGERISYTITMFLSLAVYMTLVGDNMPKVSEPMAGISYFLLVSMLFSCVLIILTIFTLRWHARIDASNFPNWLRRLVLLLKKKEKKANTIGPVNHKNNTENGNYSGQNATQNLDINTELEGGIRENLEKDDVVNFIDNALFVISEIIVVGLIFGFTYGYYR